MKNLTLVMLPNIAWFSVISRSVWTTEERRFAKETRESVDGMTKLSDGAFVRGLGPSVIVFR
jgi:hypothetical protein